MKKKMLMIMVAASVFIALAALFLLNSSPPKKSAAAGTGAAAEQKQQQEEPTPEAGQGQTSEEETPAVEISTEQQQLIGVKTTAAEVRPLHKVIRTVGLVEYDERKLATVNTKFEGWVERLHVDYTGRHVRKGEPLAEIYSPELLATQQEFINLLKWREQGKSIGDREVGSLIRNDSDAIIEGARQRLRLWDISEDQIKKIELTGKPTRTLTIYSPASGYVVQKNAVQGLRVGPGEKLFDIADLSTVWILSDIFEYELPLVKPGEKAVISLSYFPGREFTSNIDYVYPAISGETRSAKVRFSIPNPGDRLKPQMYTNVEVKINLGNKLIVPEDAVLDAGKRQIVYVDKGEGRFEPHEVELGVRAEGMVEILKGLKAGERVASSANFLIDSEAKLKGVVK